MKQKKRPYSPELSFNDKWRLLLFLEDILDCLHEIEFPNKNKVTERVFIKVVPYINDQERNLLFKFTRYINAHPYHLWNSVKKWSNGCSKYSRLLINDSDEIGYVDITLLYRT